MNDITEVDRLNAEIADLKRTIEWYQGRTGIMMGAAAGAALAAVPASEPVAYLVDWHDIGEGAGKSCFYDVDAKQHMESAVSYALHARTRPSTVTPLYAAAPAPVSGIPDLAGLVHDIIALWDSQHVSEDDYNEEMGRIEAAMRAAFPSPQAPDAPVAPAKGPLTRCAASRDGDCTHPKCPQLRDNEPHATGRHCPIDTSLEDEQ